MSVFIPDFEISLLADRCRAGEILPEKTYLSDEMVFRIKQYHLHDRGRQDAQEIIDLFPDEVPGLTTKKREA